MKSAFRFGELTYQEIKQRAETGCLAVLPTGCTEQQGPHLPVAFDTWMAEALSVAAAQRAYAAYGINALVLPAIPFGPTPEHRNFGSGYIDVPQELHESLVSAILESLREQGFQRLLIWRGCGGHHLDEVVWQFNQRNQGQALAFQPDFPHHRIWCQVGNPTVPGGHADSFATSIALYLRPESVRQELIADPQSRAVNWEDPHLDFSQYSATGVIGDPTHASAELGQRLWQALVEEVATIFKDIARTPLKQ